MNEYENYLNYKNIINTSDDLNDIESCSSQNEIETIENLKTNYLATSKSQKGHIITKRILEWSKSLTAHGFPKLFIAKRLTVKFLWSLALIASISLAIYYIYKELVKYFHYEYESHLETIFERPSLFPAITLCHINSLKSKEAENLVVDIFKADHGIDLNGNHSLTPHELIEKLEYVTLKARLRTFLPEYGDENRRRLGFSLEETLIECFYNHHSCDHRDFIWTFSLDYGNCFQFNSGYNYLGETISKVNTTRPGKRISLNKFYFQKLAKI